MGVVNHVGLTVSDLARSVAFYRDVVGLEVALDGYHTGGDWFDTLTDNSGAAIEVAMLVDGDVCLQLVQYHEAGGEAVPTGHHRVGNVHVSVNVDDLEARHADLVAAGHDPTPIVALPGAGARSFYVHDPDGVPVELMESAAP